MPDMFTILHTHPSLCLAKVELGLVLKLGLRFILVFNTHGLKG